jgi:hypothetical protein
VGFSHSQAHFCWDRDHHASHNGAADKLNLQVERRDYELKEMLLSQMNASGVLWSRERENQDCKGGYHQRRQEPIAAHKLTAADWITNGSKSAEERIV